METWQIALIVVVIIGCVVFEMAKSKKAKTAADSGQDKNAIQAIANELVPMAGNFTTVHAYWEEKDISGTASRVKVATSTWHFALSFNHEEAYVIPLQLGEHNIGHGEAIRYTPENVSLVNGKDGQSWVSFYGLDGEELISLFVDGQLLKSDDKALNINQIEEQERFRSWVPRFMTLVNTAHGTTASGKIKKK